MRPTPTHPEKITCTNKNTLVSFADLKAQYVIYDKNSASVKLLSCEKIKIKGLVFYATTFSSEIHEGKASQKVLTYEVALLNKKTKTLNTVRSEIIDHIELSGDLVDTNFDTSIKTEWGLSKKDDGILLKIHIHAQNEKPFSYLLRLNSQSSWFENIKETN